MPGESKMPQITGSRVYFDSDLPTVQNPGKIKTCCRGEVFLLEIGLGQGVTGCLVRPGSLLPSTPRQLPAAGACKDGSAVRGLGDIRGLAGQAEHTGTH